jgi:hypothetical protein
MAAKAMKTVTNSPSIEVQCVWGCFKEALPGIGLELSISKPWLALVLPSKRIKPYVWRRIGYLYICKKAHPWGGYISRRLYRSKAQAHAIPIGEDHDDIDMAGKRVILALFIWAVALLPIFMPHGTWIHFVRVYVYIIFFAVLRLCAPYLILFDP